MTDTEKNGDGPTASVFFNIYQRWQDLQKRKAQLASDEKKLKKQASDDGVDWDDMKRADKERAKPLAEQIRSHNNMTMYLRYMKQPLGAHLTIIDTTVSDETNLTPEQRQEKWENHGYLAGRIGQAMDAPLSGQDPNSETGRWIVAGWERGQAENATKIKAAKKTSAPPSGETGKVPQDEPEVAKAKAAAAAKKAGLTYWHNAGLKKVYEITTADPDPEGAVSITKPEYDRLKAEYAAADAKDWEQSQPGAKDDGGFDAPLTGKKTEGEEASPPKPTRGRNKTTH